MYLTADIMREMGQAPIEIAARIETQAGASP
jgi:hypothetical protein